MKISIVISILILAIAGFIGWGNQEKISTNQATNAVLTAEAASMGIAMDANGKVKVKARRTTRAPRVDKEAEAHQAALDFIAFARELEALQKKGGHQDESMQKRILDMVDRMLSLDSGQLKILIAEFQAETNIGKDIRDGMIMFAIMTLSNDHPEAALSLFTGSADLLENAGMSNHLLSSSLASWASKDPTRALEWVRENSAKYPDLITDDVKAGLLKGAAQNDLSLAFNLIEELKMKATESALAGIARSLNSDDQRTEYLELLREKMMEMGDKENRTRDAALRNLASGLAKEGFAKASTWMADSGLSESEKDAMADTLSYSTNDSETGDWIGWMGENSSEKNRDSRIGNTMARWTEKDYRAAGEWLAKEQPGPTKDASVTGYAKTIARYDLPTATQWALTLPVGEKRKETLNQIYGTMPTKTVEDNAARDAFRLEHGIK